jgi:acyl carrier protein
MSDKNQMINEIKQIVKPYIQDEKGFEEMHEETDFINDLQINSANLIDVILDIEDKYDIEFDNESMNKMSNVKAALAIIKTKVAEK